MNTKKTRYQKYRAYLRPYLRAYNRRWRQTVHGRKSVRATYEKRYAVRRAIIAAAKAQPCADCHRHFPGYVMDLDHVRGKKCFEVGSATFYALKKLYAEIAKCDPVCANCHRVRTFQHQERG